MDAEVLRERTRQLLHVFLPYKQQSDEFLAERLDERRIRLERIENDETEYHGQLVVGRMKTHRPHWTEWGPPAHLDRPYLGQILELVPRTIPCLPQKDGRESTWQDISETSLDEKDAIQQLPAHIDYLAPCDAPPRRFHPSSHSSNTQELNRFRAKIVSFVKRCWRKTLIRRRKRSLDKFLRKRKEHLSRISRAWGVSELEYKTLVETYCTKAKELLHPRHSSRVNGHFVELRLHERETVPTHITNFSKLSFLRLKSCDFGSLPIYCKEEVQLSYLKTLWIEDCHALQQLFDFLGNLPSLERLDMKGCSNVPWRDIDAVSHLGISSVPLQLPRTTSDIRLVDCVLHGLHFPPTVENLLMRDCTCVRIFPPQNIKKLEYNAANVLHKSCWFLENLETLKLLRIDDTRILRTLYFHGNLEELVIDRTFKPLWIEGLVFHNLKRFALTNAVCVSRNNIFPCRVVARTFPNLTFLALGGKRPDTLEVDLKDLPLFTNLERLKLCNCSVIKASETSSPDVYLPHLKSLETNHGVEDFYHVLHLPKLRGLFFWQQLFNEIPQAVRRQFLERSPYLSYIRLDAWQVHVVEIAEVRLGLEMARSRVLGRQPVKLSLWPLILSNAQKAMAVSCFDCQDGWKIGWFPEEKRPPRGVSQQDAIFHILRERGVKEILDSW